MIKYDYHLHTAFSSDSEASMRSMIEAAIAAGLDGICFTEHYDYDFPDNLEQLDFLLDFDAYKNAVLFYKEEYASRIKICHGIEIGVQKHIRDHLDLFYNKYGADYDFILSSCHVVANMDPYEPVYFEKHPGVAGMKLYFETLLHNLQVFDHFQSCAHLDYAYRYYPDPRPEFSYSLYGEILDEILNLLIKNDKALEVNTSGLRSGLPFANPHLDILKRYRELGGKMITIGSDAHKPEHVGHDFHNIEDYLKAAGFDCYTVFEKQKPSFIKL